MPKACLIHGCDLPRAYKGWCGRHYSRWQRYGDPLWPVVDRPTVHEVVQSRAARKYNVTDEHLAGLRAAQLDRCAICLEPLGTAPRSVHIDHCHTTGAVRGILCRECNLGIGFLRDDPERCLAASKYLANAPHSPIAASAV